MAAACLNARTHLIDTALLYWSLNYYIPKQRLLSPELCYQTCFIFSLLIREVACKMYIY